MLEELSCYSPKQEYVAVVHALLIFRQMLLRQTFNHVARPQIRSCPRHRSALLYIHGGRDGPSRSLHTSSVLYRRQLIFSGETTADEEHPSPPTPSTSPYYFETGFAIFAKRPSRPFPPPFLSTPSHSFSDPLTTHQALRGRKPQDAQGRIIGGITNGDDAVIVGGNNFLGVGDGVGAWAQKERGHAALWSRLVMNYWAAEVSKLFEVDSEAGGPTVDDIDMVACMQRAFEQTKKSTGASGSGGEDTAREEIMGTTTASGAVLHHDEGGRAVVVATTLGDSMVYIVRPDRGEQGDAGSEDEDESQGDLLYKTTEQWHWFDCPRQLGTNSPDTPNDIAVMDKVAIEVGDVVVVVSDGVSDNLFEVEIVQKVCGAVKSWERGNVEAKDGMAWVARELMNSAREIAQDPNAESPYMEKALDEGISAYGGKLDDISVVVGVCRRRGAT